MPYFAVAPSEGQFNVGPLRPLEPRNFGGRTYYGTSKGLAQVTCVHACEHTWKMEGVVAGEEEEEKDE